MKCLRKLAVRPTFDHMTNSTNHTRAQTLTDRVIAHYQSLDRSSRDASRVIVDPAGDGILLARSATGSEQQLSQQIEALDRFCTDEGRKPRLVIVSGAPSTRVNPRYLQGLEQAFAAAWCHWTAAYDVTRYGRVTTQLERLLRSAQQHNVEVWTCASGIDLAGRSELSRMFVESLVADAYGITTRTRRGRARRRH